MSLRPSAAKADQARVSQAQHLGLHGGADEGENVREASTECERWLVRFMGSHLPAFPFLADGRTRRILTSAPPIVSRAIPDAVTAQSRK